MNEMNNQLKLTNYSQLLEWNRQCGWEIISVGREIEIMMKIIGKTNLQISGVILCLSKFEF
jgi:hypothetical protein